MNKLVAAGFAFVLLICGSAHAAPAVYTVYAVTDGKLGSLTFSKSPVTLTFYGDTSDVTMQTVGGKFFYRIDEGYATFAVTVLGATTVAEIAKGQIYVHYDVQNGLVGFGSGLGPTYPLTLGCGNPSQACQYGLNDNPPFGMIVSAIADLAAAPHTQYYSATTLEALPTTLSQSTLLTGYVGACAVPEAYQGCASAAPTPIQTDQGDLYLQDLQGNGKGIFTVEVFKRDD
jgi:hypothetical protein